MKYIRTKYGEILDVNNTNKCIYVIRDSKESDDFRYVSYLWDNWRNYFLVDYQNCMLFSYNSAQSFISDLIKENLEYQNLVIELSPYYQDCKQADTIEELFMPNDLLVVGDEESQMPIFIESIEYLNAWLFCHDIYKIKEFYIKRGNDYHLVAKMNDEGEFELI